MPSVLLTGFSAHKSRWLKGPDARRPAFPKPLSSTQPVREILKVVQRCGNHSQRVVLSLYPITASETGDLPAFSSPARPPSGLKLSSGSALPPHRTGGTRKD